MINELIAKKTKNFTKPHGQLFVGALEGQDARNILKDHNYIIESFTKKAGSCMIKYTKKGE